MADDEPRRVTDYLIDDHVRLHELLVRATSGGAFDAEPFAAFRRGLLRHIAIEEKVLFPAAKRARGGVALERVHELRVEHAALGSLLVPTPDEALCDEIAALLSAHDDKEEGPGGLYVECEALFSDEESQALAREATSVREIAVAPHLDGPDVYRTAARALAAASRMRPSR